MLAVSRAVSASSYFSLPGGFAVWKLLPRTDKFFALFEQGAQNTVNGAYRLVELLEDFREVEPRVRAIEELEHNGDRILHDIMRELHHTFITPIDREDIHAIAKDLDDVIDFIEAAADRMFLFQIAKPTPKAVELGHLIVQATEELHKALAALRTMRVENVRRHCVEVNRVENEADRIHREALAGLFAVPGDPSDIIKWKDIYEHLETVTDCCEHVANTLEGVIMKYA